MIPKTTLLLAVALLTAGCQTAKESFNPTAAQLEGFKGLAAEGRYAQIAATEVTCEAGQAGCAQLHWIKADACYRMGTDAAPPASASDGPGAAQGAPTSAAKQLDCAVANYAAAWTDLAAAPDPNVKRDQVELGALESLRRRRDLAESTADAVRYNDLLLQRATAAEHGPVAQPAGYYYAANARLNSILLQSSQGGCTELAVASEDLRRAQADGTSFAAAANALHRAIANAGTARGCAP